MTGRQFEDYAIKRLQAAGFWAHRIHPDESGQQPFDIIAVKDGRICAYDAKVVSTGKRFPLSRIEDNQYNSFMMFKRKAGMCEAGLIIINATGKVRFMSIEVIKRAIDAGLASVSLDFLPEWRIA